MRQRCAAGSAGTSVCFNEDKQQVEGCTCHPSCASCGYYSWPSGSTDCVTCADGSEVMPYFDDGTGACGEVELVESPTQQAGAPATMTPFFIRDMKVVYDESFMDFEMTATVPETAVKATFDLHYTYTSDPSVMYLSSSQAGTLEEDYDDANKDPVVVAYWLGDTFGLYQSVNGTEDPRVALATPFDAETVDAYYYSDVYAYETDIDTDGDGATDAVRMEIPVMYYPTAEQLGTSIEAAATGINATLHVTYEFSTGQEKMSLFGSFGVGTPVEVRASEGGMFVPKVTKEVGGSVTTTLSNQIFLWGRVAPKYDGSAQYDALFVEYYNVFSDANNVNYEPMFKDFTVELSAMDGATATKRFTYPISALQDSALLTSFDASPNFSKEKPAVTATATINGATLASFQDEAMQTIFRESIAFAAGLTS